MHELQRRPLCFAKRKVRTPQGRKSFFKKDVAGATPREGKRNREQTAGRFRTAGKGETAV